MDFLSLGSKIIFRKFQKKIHLTSSAKGHGTGQRVGDGLPSFARDGHQGQHGHIDGGVLGNLGGGVRKTGKFWEKICEIKRRKKILLKTNHKKFPKSKVQKRTNSSFRL